MSIDLNWEALTSGPDGDALAERIRAFIHDKFQTVPLPRFIKSVTVHGFDFGTVPPELALKDISDPLPDFYEPQSPDDGDDEDDETDGDDEAPNQDERPQVGDDYHHHHHHHQRQQHKDKHRQKSNGQSPRSGGRVRPPNINMGSGNAYFSGHHHHHHDLASPFMGTSTPGLLGGPALGYLHGHLGTGTQTPLAAVAGAHLGNSWLGSGFDNASAAAATEAAAVSADTARSHVAPSHGRKFSQGSISVDNPPSHFGSPSRPQQSAASAAAATSSPSRRGLNEKSSVSTLAPTITSNSRPPTRDSRASSSSSAAALLDPDYGRNVATGHDGDGADNTAPAANVLHDPAGQPPPGRRREPRAEDVQAVFRIRYTGDVRLNLTAEILLDYPMPSFVGIPLKLNITGMSFDGVGVLAHIRKRVHFCFLSPEDAVTAVGGQNDEHDNDGDGNDNDGGAGGPAGSSSKNGSGGGGGSKPRSSTRFGGLLQEIKVESEIGGREGGKQSLKNVGKVEKFVLEQVRRIFDEEFVYPSFWTFLV